MTAVRAPRRRPRTPLGWAAARWTIRERGLRWGTTAALVTSVLIVLGGGVVRVTGSGLGCPTWPTCDGTSIAPIEPGIHAVIEFANRLLTVVLIAAVGWAIVAARLQPVRDRMLTRLAWSQFWLVVANAIAGGITVLAGLNPWVVALHFVLAVGLLATATLTWHRARTALRAPVAPATPLARRLAWGVAGTTLVLILVGTLVSGSGPHAGDSADVPRMGLDWTTVTVVHGILGTAVLVLALVLLVVARRSGHRLSASRTLVFLAVVAAQGLLGVVQSLIGLPEVLVALHLLGSALVWVGALRVLLDTDTRLFAVDELRAVEGETVRDRTAESAVLEDSAL